MTINIISAFPNAFSFLSESIVKRAQESSKVTINIVDLRNFGLGKWKKIDDRPFGGGAGMLLQIEPIYVALKSVDAKRGKSNSKIILTSAGGQTWSSAMAKSYSSDIEKLTIICGHYEGVDQRVIDNLIDEEISIGNFILSGGELASMVLVDSIVRLIPGVLGNEISSEHETKFGEGFKIKEHPQYTRPAVFKTDDGVELKVPEILLSGNHSEIKRWEEDSSEWIRE